ncbi:MAG: hypothetical protein AAFS10_06300 [Myxococcota bacterium]
MTTTLESNSTDMPQLTEEQLEQAIRGELAVVWQGRRLPLRLQRDELEAYRKAQEEGYVLVRRRRMNLPFAYGAWCDLQHRPSIKIEVRRVYAAVQLHMITASPRRLSTPEQEQVREHFRRWMEVDAWFTSSELYAYCSKVRTERAQVLAQALQLMLHCSRPGSATVDMAALEGDALTRAQAVGYLVVSIDHDRADAARRAWRAWCHRHRRPTLVVTPQRPETPGEISSCNLEILPTQYASARFQQFTVEDVRRILLCISRLAPERLGDVLEGMTTGAEHTQFRGAYLTHAAVGVGPLPLRQACRLAAAVLASMGVRPGDVQPVDGGVEPEGEPCDLPLFNEA